LSYRDTIAECRFAGDPDAPPRDHDAIEAFGRVWNELIFRIKGDAWKLTDRVVEELRAKKYPKPLK
jgi:hypothetical protein